MGHFMKILEADLILVIGTALAVSPFNSVVYMNREAKKALINRENTQEFYDFTKKPTDCFLQGNADDTIQSLVDELGWNEEFNKLLEERKALLEKIPEDRRKSKL